MTRVIRVAAVQMGPVDPSESRAAVVRRLTDLLRDGAARGAELVVFPEVALTPFFPHWMVASEAELDSYFEQSMPNPGVQPLFDAAAELRVGFCAGLRGAVPWAGRVRPTGTTARSSSSATAGRSATTARSTCPGYATRSRDHPFQHLEKRYFEVGDLGFPVWSRLRRARRHVHLQRPPLARDLPGDGPAGRRAGSARLQHARAQSRRPAERPPGGFPQPARMQAGAYQNGTWVVGVAKAGVEDGVEQIGGTCVIAPTGEVVAEAHDRRRRDRHRPVRPRPRPCVQGVRLRPRRQPAARTLCAAHGARGTRPGTQLQQGGVQ